MANGKIEIDDILDKKIKDELKKIADETKNVVSQLEKLYSTAKQLSTELKKNTDTQEKLNDSTKKVNENTKKLTDVEKEIVKINNQYNQVVAKTIAEQTEQNKKLVEATQKRKEQNKAINESIQMSKAEQLSQNALNGTYKQIQSALTANILKYQNLTKAERENKSIGGELIKTIQQQDKQLKQIDASMGRFSRNVGNYGNAFNGLAKSFRSLIGAFGIATGVFAFAKVIKDSFNKVKDFEKAMSVLKSVANATDEQMKRLKKSALDLGAATPKTASEVAQLQTEFAKLGFTTDEILNATQATINLSLAAGTDLANAASIAGSTLRGFQLSTTETTRVIDVMTKSFSSSALDISNFSEAMKYVAPVAKAAGFTIEEATAMLGKLADAGIRGSMAGTSLRMIMLKMAESGMKGMYGFDKMAKAGISLAEANDEVGQRAQTSLLVLSEQKKEVLKLTDVLNNAAGSAQEMADVMADNLAGDVDKATSAWEGFILSVDSGQGVVSRASRKIVQLFTDIVNSLTLANKAVDELTKNVQDESISELIKRDREEVDKLGQKYIDARNESIRYRQEEISALRAQRDELLKNESVTSDELNNNTELIRGKIAQIVIETKLRDAAIMYIQEKLENEKKRIIEENAAKEEAAKAEKERVKKLNKEKEDLNKKYYDQARALKENETKILKESLDDDLKSYDENIKARINLVTDEFINGKRSAESLSDEILAIQVEETEKKLEFARANGIDTLDIETELINSKKSLKDAELDHYKQIENQKQEKAKQTAEIEQEIANKKVELFNAAFELFSTLNEAEISDLESRRDYELEMAGDNASKKEAIETKYNGKIKQLKRQQAISEKLNGIFSIGINTAMAIMKNTAELGLIPAQPINILTALLGGVQAATVLAKPIPKFFKGVRNFTGGLADVGERGWELGETKNHDFFITPDTATRMMLPSGTNIYTHEESQKKVKELNSNIDVDRLIKEQQLTRKAISEKTENHVSLTQKGLEVFSTRNRSKKIYVDKYIRH